MYYFDNKKHNEPHIHANYNEYDAVISIDTGNVLDGDLPLKKLKLVLAWIEIHKDDLYADWKLAIQGQELYKIDPLK